MTAKAAAKKEAKVEAPKAAAPVGKKVPIDNETLFRELKEEIKIGGVVFEAREVRGLDVTLRRKDYR